MSSRPSDGDQTASRTATTSSSSPGHLPTTKAARRRPAASKRTGVPRRFEDFLSANEPAEEAAEDPFLTSIRSAKRKSTSRAKSSLDTAPPDGDALEQSAEAGPSSSSPRRPSSPTHSSRSNTLGSERTDHLVPAVGSSDSTARVPRVPGLTRVAAPTGPRRTASGSNRRSSLNFKTSRRASNLRDGTVAHPHPSVPDKELYRHCADDMTPVARMKYLASWTLDRARSQVADTTFASASQPHSYSKARLVRDDIQGEGPWNASERKILDRCKASVEKVMAFTLRDLSEQKLNLSWLGTHTSATARTASAEPQPNPRNEENRVLAEDYSALVAALRSENARWEEERQAIETFEGTTASILRAGSSSDGQRSLVGLLASDITSVPQRMPELAEELQWHKRDLNERAHAMLGDAQRALALESRQLVAPDDHESAQLLQASIKAATSSHIAILSSRPKSRAQRSGGDVVKSFDRDLVQGTEQDERWQDLEFLSDLLRSRVHGTRQLGLLSSSYTSSISSRAAQALRQLAFPANDPNEGVVSASAPSTLFGGTTRDGESDVRARARRERLLRGIRESIGPARKQEMEDEKMFSEWEESDGNVINGRSPADQSAVDLFRAFASKPASSSSSLGAKREGVS